MDRNEAGGQIGTTSVLRRPGSLFRSLDTEFRRVRFPNVEYIENGQYRDWSDSLSSCWAGGIRSLHAIDGHFPQPVH